jgi:hypothetical protein
MEEYQRQNGPLSGHDKVRGWLRDVPSCPTQPAAPRKDQHVSDSDSEYGRLRRRPPPATRITHGVLHVHKDYKGPIPVCYYDTGLREGGPNDGYACFDRRDMLWALQVRYHIERRQSGGK